MQTKAKNMNSIRDKAVKGNHAYHPFDYEDNRAAPPGDAVHSEGIKTSTTQIQTYTSLIPLDVENALKAPQEERLKSRLRSSLYMCYKYWLFSCLILNIILTIPSFQKLKIGVWEFLTGAMSIYNIVQLGLVFCAFQRHSYSLITKGIKLMKLYILMLWIYVFIYYSKLFGLEFNSYFAGLRGFDLILLSALGATLAIISFALLYIFGALRVRKILYEMKILQEDVIITH